MVLVEGKRGEPNETSATKCVRAASNTFSLSITVKSSNFVILLSENIFFAKLSLDYPKHFSGIEVCTDGAYAFC